MKKKTKGYIDRSETFDEFLAKDGLLAEYGRIDWNRLMRV
jgi:hypothetical protein